MFESEFPIESEEYFSEFFEAHREYIRIIKLVTGEGIIAFSFQFGRNTSIAFPVQFRWSFDHDAFTFEPFIPTTGVVGIDVKTSNILFEALPSEFWIKQFAEYFLGSSEDESEVMTDTDDEMLESILMAQSRDHALDREIDQYESMGEKIMNRVLH